MFPIRTTPERAQDSCCHRSRVAPLAARSRTDREETSVRTVRRVQERSTPIPPRAGWRTIEPSFLLPKLRLRLNVGDASDLRMFRVAGPRDKLWNGTTDCKAWAEGESLISDH